MGIKGALYRVWQKFIRMLKYAICFFYREVVCNTLQWILAGAIVAALFWVYGRQLILTYGYRASDIPVHLNWINQMSRGNLFVSGVYPFGFHCVVYYLHTVFRVDTYVILCLFYLVQVFFIHVVLLAMLKMLCRSLYFPYAGVLVYILGSFWTRQTYSRFGASLPQEFGMFFVIPSIYFLIRFFQTEKEEFKLSGWYSAYTEDNGRSKAIGYVSEKKLKDWGYDIEEGSDNLICQSNAMDWKDTEEKLYEDVPMKDNSQQIIATDTAKNRAVKEVTGSYGMAAVEAR